MACIEVLSILFYACSLRTIVPYHYLWSRIKECTLLQNGMNPSLKRKRFELFTGCKHREQQ